MKNSIFLFVSLSIASISLEGQERLGLRIDNYSGVNTLYLNPASGTSLPYKWDVNIISAEIFADNNFGFIRNANVIDFQKGGAEIVLTPNNEVQAPEGTFYADYSQGKPFYYAQANTQIMGPSFLTKVKENHSIGLITAFRASGGSRKIPNPLGYYEFDSQPLETEFIVDPFKTAAAAWAEIGLHYSYQSPDYSSVEDNHWSIGGNLKYLAGFEGAYFNNLKKSGITKNPNNEIQIVTGDIEFGLTTDYIYDEEFDRVRVNGGGIALDLGFQYIISNDIDEGYKWKLGASLLDFGYIRFGKNAERHRLDNLSPLLYNLDEYEALNNYEDAINLLSSDVYNDPDASLRGNSFSLALPMALSMQADYSVNKNIFLNAAFIQHIPLGKNRLARTDVLALTPRFENRWFGAMLPISLLNYNQIHVGLSLRLAYLTLGTENLGSLFGNSNLTGSDFYLALKINPFKIDFTRDKKFKRKSPRIKAKGKRELKCYF